MLTVSRGEKILLIVLSILFLVGLSTSAYKKIRANDPCACSGSMRSLKDIDSLIDIVGFCGTAVAAASGGWPAFAGNTVSWLGASTSAYRSGEYSSFLPNIIGEFNKYSGAAASATLGVSNALDRY